MPEPVPGLRERKRRATRLAIQQAALRIAVEDGLAAVTVDEVSRRADISPRTFFNYFPSKEQALLGDDPALPDDETIEVFVSGGPSGDVLTDVGVMLVHATRELPEERGLVEERQQVLRAAPELFSQRMASMKEFQAALQDVVARRLRHDDPQLAADERELESRARLVSLVSLAALRHAWWAWSESSAESQLVDDLHRSFDALGALVSRSLV